MQAICITCLLALASAMTQGQANIARHIMKLVQPPQWSAISDSVLHNNIAFADLKERFTGLGLDADSSGPDEFGAFVASEIKKYGRIAEGAGIKPQ